MRQGLALNHVIIPRLDTECLRPWQGNGSHVVTREATHDDSDSGIGPKYNKQPYVPISYLYSTN